MRNPSTSLLVPAATLFALAGLSFAQAPQSQSSSSVATETSWLAPSTEMDQALPHWLQFGGEDQIRAEGVIGAGFKLHNANDGYLLNRIRFDMKLLPTSWLKFDFQAQDAQAFWKNQKPYAPPFQDTWDLSRANVTIGNLESNHVQAQVGRQLMMFGDGRLIGNLEWLNSARAYDAARVDSSYGKYRLSAFAASVVLQQDGQVGYHNLGSYVEGFYGGLDNVIPESTIEPYFFWRRNPGQKMENGKLGNEHFGVPGVRWVGKLPYGFDYGTEVAVERGSIATDTLAAWASHVALGYASPPVATFASHFTTEYNFASGGNSVKAGVHNTFDTIYASSHDKYDFTDEIGWKNIKNLRQTLSTNLTRKIGVAVKYGDYWLDNSHDALYTISSVVVAQSKNGTAGTWVGQEIDGILTYSFPNHSRVITGFGYLMPGTFLKETTPGHTYSYPFLGYNTNF